MFGVNYVGIHFKALKHGINTSMRSVMIKLIKTFSMNRKLDTYFITKLGYLIWALLHPPPPFPFGHFSIFSFHTWT